MPLQKVELRPGVNRESTSYANEGGFFAGDKIRFRSGYAEKIGGWQNTARGLGPLQELIGRFHKIAPVGLHPQPRALQIAEAHVEGKRNEAIKDSLATSSSRAKSKYTALKPTKVLSKKSVHLSHTEDTIPACGYR